MKLASITCYPTYKAP